MSKNSNQWEGFDDCIICRAMKQADKDDVPLTEQELIELFNKAKDNGAIVSGDYFDELPGND